MQRRLYIDEAHMALDIFRFAVFFFQHPLICTILKYPNCACLSILGMSEAISNPYQNYIRYIIDIIFAYYLRLISSISKAYLKNTSSISYTILILLYRCTEVQSSYLFYFSRCFSFLILCLFLGWRWSLFLRLTSFLGFFSV